jgi:Virulence factor
MTELTVIWWRAIPAQVVAREGRRTARAQLTNRFQEAIDVAATRAGLIGTDDYLKEWHRETRLCGDDLDAEAAAEAERLERAYPDAALDTLVRAGGLAGDGGSA